MVERSITMVKPDAVKRGLAGVIISRLEKQGLKIVGLKMLRLTSEQIEQQYKALTCKPFFARLVEYMMSGPVIIAVLEGQDAVAQVRWLVGATNPSEAAEGTIRRDYGLNTLQNSIHAASSPEAAEDEIKLYFKDGELVSG